MPLSCVVVGLVVTDAANHDLILFDRDLDRAMTGPVLGVDRIVLDRGVEPQAVPLFAVVERRLERRGLAPGAAASTAAASPALGRRLLAVTVLVLVLFLGVFLGALGLGGFELGGDQRVVLGSKINLIIEVGAGAGAGGLGVGLGLEALLALERLDLLHGHLELVCDPRVGASLADPAANSVQLWS